MSQNIEFEGKILDIDVDHVISTIKAVGGKQVGNYTFRRYVFNTLPAKQGRWVRLRTNGEKTTLTVKEIAHDDIDGTSEWEVEVSDFETTLAILQKSGLSHKGYQENRRIEFSLGDAMLCIDFWPHLLPYLEIEAKNKNAVENIVSKLGFKASNLVGLNTAKLYAEKGINLDKVAELRF